MIARAAFLTTLMIAAALASAIVKSPAPAKISAPDLAALAPEKFGDWQEIEISSVVLPAELELGPGEAILYRAYSDNAGRTVTLVAAYGPPLGDSVRLHRPESCYVAQGYTIAKRSKTPLVIGDYALPVIRMDTEKSLRREAVSYWLRDGDAFAESAADHQLLSFRRGVSNRADGALVRVSSSGAGETVYEIHIEFLSAFVDALPPEGRKLFLGEVR
ncbi:MAG: EpsI family protein [Marinicaulis sp.]|nr:EpsI family protein [Marinicaulis sp.]